MNEKIIFLIILYFICLNNENKNKNKKDLLTLDEIKALTSISVEGSSNVSYFPISKYLDFNNKEENENIKILKMKII